MQHTLPIVFAVLALLFPNTFAVADLQLQIELAKTELEFGEPIVAYLSVQNSGRQDEPVLWFDNEQFRQSTNFYYTFLFQDGESVGRGASAPSGGSVHKLNYMPRDIWPVLEPAAAYGCYRVISVVDRSSLPLAPGEYSLSISAYHGEQVLSASAKFTVLERASADPSVNELYGVSLMAEALSESLYAARPENTAAISDFVEANPMHYLAEYYEAALVRAALLSWPNRVREVSRADLPSEVTRLSDAVARFVNKHPEFPENVQFLIDLARLTARYGANIEDAPIAISEAISILDGLEVAAHKNFRTELRWEAVWLIERLEIQREYTEVYLQLEDVTLDEAARKEIESELARLREALDQFNRTINVQ